MCARAAALENCTKQKDLQKWKATDCHAQDEWNHPVMGHRSTRNASQVGIRLCVLQGSRHWVQRLQSSLTALNPAMHASSSGTVGHLSGPVTGAAFCVLEG